MTTAEIVRQARDRARRDNQVRRAARLRRQFEIGLFR